MPSWPIFFTIKWFYARKFLRIVCTPINNGEGVKNPLSYPVLRLTPSFWMFLWIIVIRKKMLNLGQTLKIPL